MFYRSAKEELKLFHIVSILLLLLFQFLLADGNYRVKRNIERPDTAQCSAISEYRIDCGYKAISKESCENLNCCFKNAVSCVPWCYWSIESLQASTLTDCISNRLDFTVDIAFILDSSCGNDYESALSNLKTLLMKNTTFSLDIVRPATATYVDSFKILFNFSNDALSHKSDSEGNLTAENSHCTLGIADLSSGLKAIIQIFNTTMTRPGVPRVAVLYITSENTINITVLQKQMEIIQSLDIDVIIINTTAQSIEFETVLPSNLFIANFSALATASCMRVKTRINNQKSSLASLQLHFGDVKFLLDMDDGSEFILFTNTSVQKAGSIYRIKLHARDPGRFYIMIFRWINNAFTLANEIEVVIKASGIQSVDLIRFGVLGVQVQEDDLIGLRASSTMSPLIIPYSQFICTEEVGNIQFYPNINVTVGNSYNFSRSESCRNYSLEIIYTTETAKWSTYEQRSLILDPTTAVKRFTQVPSIKHCQQYCLNELNFVCKAVEYSNNGDNVCRIFNESYVKGVSIWNEKESFFDHSIWIIENVMNNTNNMDTGNGGNDLSEHEMASNISVIGGSIAGGFVLGVLVVLALALILWKSKHLTFGTKQKSRGPAAAVSTLQRYEYINPSESTQQNHYQYHYQNHHPNPYEEIRFSDRLHNREESSNI